MYLPRLSRFTLGSKIDSLFCELLELLLDAAYTDKNKKTFILEKADIKLDALKFFLQTVWEMKILDNKKYSGLAESLVEIGRMLGGWQKQVQKKLLRLEENKENCDEGNGSCRSTDRPDDPG